MLNIRLLKDAVARWQTYEDRGIKPHTGWGKGGDGNSCALGDIAHYENLDIRYFQAESVVCHFLDLPQFGKNGLPVGVVWNSYTETENLVIHGVYFCPYAVVNDHLNRWPIAEAQRMIEWEEATIEYENRKAAPVKEFALLGGF